MGLDLERPAGWRRNREERDDGRRRAIKREQAVCPPQVLEGTWERGERSRHDRNAVRSVRQRDRPPAARGMWRRWRRASGGAAVIAVRHGASRLCILLLLAACGSGAAPPRAQDAAGDSGRVDGNVDGASGDASDAGAGGRRFTDAGGTGGLGHQGSAGAAGLAGAGGGGSGMGGNGAMGDAGHGGIGAAGGVGGTMGGAPSLDLGLGGGGFHRLPDGATVATVIGPQGSPMMVLAVRASGIRPGDVAMPSMGDPLVRVVCRSATDEIKAQGQNQRGFSPSPEPGFYELDEIWTPLFTGSPGGAWSLRCVATVVDADGRMLSDARTVTATF